MKLEILLLSFFALVTVYSLTCQKYDDDKCISIGCDLHCQFLGKRTGICRLEESLEGVHKKHCTCMCVDYNGNTIPLEETEIQNDGIEYKPN